MSVILVVFFANIIAVTFLLRVMVTTPRRNALIVATLSVTIGVASAVTVLNAPLYLGARLRYAHIVTTILVIYIL